MAKGRLNNWRWWLLTLSFGLMIFAAFAPLSEASHRALTMVSSGGLLIYLGLDTPGFWMRASLILIAVVATVLLASLLSVNPKSVIFGALGVYGIACLWGVIRQEHAEYVAERERLQ